MLDLALCFFTLLLTVLYQALGIQYAQTHFDLTFTLVYRALILPLFLFCLSRIAAKFLLVKLGRFSLSQKFCRLFAALVWALHLISVIGIRFCGLPPYWAVGLSCPWLFIAVGVVSCLYQTDSKAAK